jgi:hypothetical protein
MVKADFKKSLDSYRARRGEFRIVEIPARQYLMVDGHGDPNTGCDYAEAISALYPVAYALKFASKKTAGGDYVVPPLEALWWASDMAAFTTARDKSRWDWTAMLMVPDWITADTVGAAVAATAAKSRRPGLDRVRIESLHVGPYDAEAEVLAELHERVIPAAGLRMTGKHHEIYLSDARRTDPAKLRTILRQPVEEA